MKKRLQNLNIFSLSDHTSKALLSQILGLGHTKLYQVHGVAMCIEDFWKSYPQTAQGFPVTSCGLNRYQCWVIYQLSQMIRMCPEYTLFDSAGLKLQTPVINYLSRGHYDFLVKDNSFQDVEQWNREQGFLTDAWIKVYSANYTATPTEDFNNDVN